MPTYVYKCEKCQSTFEEFQSITAEPLTDCRQDGCGGHIKRVISAGAGVLFKGSGFYQTDYRSESYKKGASADSSSSSSSGTTKTESSPKSESKPS